MIKIRNHRRIALLLVLAMLATMFVSVGAAGAVTSENGVMTISKSINNNIAEDTQDTLGYVKAAIDAEDAATGTIYWEVTLPDNVEFVGGDDTTSGTISVTNQTAVSATLPLPQVIVDSAAADEVNVDVTLNYVDASNNQIDKFEGSLLLAKKGEEGVTVTAASPKSISTGFDKKIAKVTFAEDLADSIESGSTIVMELPDDFTWDDTTPATLTQGLYGLTATAQRDPADSQRLLIKVTHESTAMADKLKVVGNINVMPGASDGDVVVSVYDDSAAGFDSNIDSTDLTVATVGGADVTVTAEDSTSSDDYIYRATEGKKLWDITFETTGSFSAGDDVFVTLPEGVEFTSAMDGATFTDFTNNGRYNDNQSLWLTVKNDTTSDLTLKGLEVGATPDAVVGDLTLTLSGDVVDTTVVASAIADKATVTATASKVKVGLDEVLGDITLVENKNKSFVDTNDVYVKLPNGVTFAAAPTVKVNGDEIDATVSTSDDAVCYFTLDGLKNSSKDTIVISDIKVDIDNRYTAGKDIVVKIGGIDAADDVNELTATAGTQFDDEADDSLYAVTAGTVYAANAVSEASFVIGSSTYTQNGTTVNCVAASYASNNRSFLAIRDIAHVMGIDDSNILWDGANQTVTLIKGDKVVQLKVGSNVILINGAAVTMDVAVQASNGRTFLPAAWVANAFGATATWDAATNTVTIK